MFALQNRVMFLVGMLIPRISQIGVGESRDPFIWLVMLRMLNGYRSTSYKNV